MSIGMIINYLREALRNTAPIFLVYLFIRALFLAKKGWRLSWKREAFLAAGVAYLLCLYQITVVRFGIDWGTVLSGGQRMDRIQLIPLARTLEEYQRGLLHLLYPILGNIAWFLPMGVFLPLLWKRKTTRPRLLWIAGAVSLSIEFLQWLLCTGISDIDDLIFNVLGAGIGFWGYRHFGRFKKKIKPFLKKIRGW